MISEITTSELGGGKIGADGLPAWAEPPEDPTRPPEEPGFIPEPAVMLGGPSFPVPPDPIPPNGSPLPAQAEPRTRLRIVHAASFSCFIARLDSVTAHSE